MSVMRKILAAAMFAGVLAVCGCSSDSGYSGGVSSSSTAAFSDEESSTASAFEIPVTAGNTESPYLTFLGTGEISPAALKTYANTAGLSSSGLGSSEPLVTVIKVSDSLYESRLSELISSDESPDLTEKRENTFPFLMSRNMYEDLTPYMDTAAPQWEGFSRYIEHYSFKNAHYFYPTGITAAPEFLVYDKMRCVQAGTADPERLWEKGEWTLDRLTEYSDAIDAVTGLGGCIYSQGIAENILAMTGTALIEKDENGKFVSRIGSNGYLEMREFFSTHRCDQKVEGTVAIRQSFTAFMCADDVFFGELRDTLLHLGIVPFPKLDSESPYYVRAVSDGFLVPKGAKNIRSAASFINCSRIAETSDEGIKERHREMKKLGFLQSDVEWIEYIRGGEYDLVLDEGLCLDKDANAAMALIFSEADMLLFNDYTEPDYNISAIDADLERINAMV